MTVALQNKEMLSETAWGKERQVILSKDERNSFGISIVGGTVNVSNGVIVSGIFIKNIIPNSPACLCKTLRIGDRIMAVNGTIIKNFDYDKAIKVIKNAEKRLVLVVQSFLNEIDNVVEHNTLTKNFPPPVTPCKTPETEAIYREKECSTTSTMDEVLMSIQCGKIVQNSMQSEKCPETSTFTPNVPACTTESDNTSEEEDVRDLEGKAYTKDGVEIDRASAANAKRSLDKFSLESDREDSFGYTTQKIKKKYGALGNVLSCKIERSSGSSLGISLAGHRDRTKMACLVAGINPKGIASTSPLKVGDEILEVNGLVLHGRSHLNVPTVIKNIIATSLTIIFLRRQSGMDDLAVKPILQFPLTEGDENIFAAFNDVRAVSMKKGSSGLGIMIIEGKHSEAGQGIFISDIQEGSSADKAGLNIGEMILAVNKDSLLGCNYETAASLLKKTEGVVVLKVYNPNIVKENQNHNVVYKGCEQVQTSISENIHATIDSEEQSNRRCITVKSTASPLKEALDPSKAVIIENQTTVVEIATNKHPLGIIVAGGSDTQISDGVVIVDVLPCGMAERDKRLQIFDQILEINSIKITNTMTHMDIQRAIKQFAPKIRIVVFRPKCNSETESFDIEVFKKCGKSLGMGFRTNHSRGMLITDILPTVPIDRNGRMHKGDIITHVNSVSLSNYPHDECVLLLKTVQGKIIFSVLRPKPQLRTA